MNKKAMDREKTCASYMLLFPYRMTLCLAFLLPQMNILSQRLGLS